MYVLLVEVFFPGPETLYVISVQVIFTGLWIFKIWISAAFLAILLLLRRKYFSLHKHFISIIFLQIFTTPAYHMCRVIQHMSLQTEVRIKVQNSCISERRVNQGFKNLISV